MDCRSEGSLIVDNHGTSSRCRGQPITFNMLPDDVLLEIFDSYMDEDMGKVFGPTKKQRIEEWQVLGHVCRRWRNVVFQSPLRLNLRLVCTPETPAKDTLDVWPPLPLIIHDTYRNGKSGVDNIIAALEHNDRVCQIELRCFSSLELGYVTDSAAMQKPFPELTDLHLSMINDDGPIIPDSFLDGTAPCLQSLTLFGVPFPGLPNVLLSATRLVNLSLYHIPLSGYIPPEVMATGISALTSLESLLLQFQYPRPPPAQERRRPPPLPPTRYIIPSLTKVRFKGTSEYLEEILTRIDAPQLDELHITFFNQVIFDTPQLFQFISRRPILRTPKKGHIAFSSRPLLSDSHHGHLTTEYSACKSHARRQNGSSHPLNRSAPRLCLPFSHWKTSTSSRIENTHHVGKRMSKTPYGWKFYICLQP